MTRSSRAFSLIGVLSLVASFVVIPAQMASAASTTYTVSIGSFHAFGANCDPQLGTGCIFAESMKYFGPTSVHTGDVLHFVGGGFDTAALLPKNTDAQDWTDKNATFPGQPYALAAPDPDEGALAFKFSNSVFFPSSFSCGPASQPCSYDGSAVVNSGVAQGDSQDFSVTVNAGPGDFFWIENLIGPRMRLKVNVVPDGTATPSQAAIDAAAASQQAQDDDEGAAVISRISHQTGHTTRSGQPVLDTYVGYDTHDLAIMGMFPKKLHLRKGQTVRYHFAQDEYFAHTITFPLNTGLDISSHLPDLVCDPDGDQGTQPDVAASPNPPFCAGGFSQVELDIPQHFLTPEGDGVMTSTTDFESSGLKGGSIPQIGSIGGNGATDIKFARAGTFKGLCMVHPEMRQTVVVR